MSDVSAEQEAAAKLTGRMILTFPAGRVVNVKAGAFANIAAKRQFGQDAMKAGDIEAVMFACWVESEGVPAKGSDLMDRFDAWLQSIEEFRWETKDEAAEAARLDPPTADPSDSSPGSPPISD